MLGQLKSKQKTTKYGTFNKKNKNKKVICVWSKRVERRRGEETRAGQTSTGCVLAYLSVGSRLPLYSLSASYWW